ncbi:LLM class flavin-dependent oxidoreductase [Bdellovibrio bacteriovorus]|uniref:LLM class flavin-dependent oxidoreductase n=1 Tax=Bdellovibrio bacteriovorus TaxID=959 RepID=UPI0035A64595
MTDTKQFSDIKISVLDLAPIAQGKTIADSFRNTLDLAQHAEKWGYNRYWMAEHHNLDGIASSATSVLIGYVAGGTKSIRVGSGGVMLPNHAPLVIAEQFGTLGTLYPDRIDLGLGRAPGTDRLTMHALRRDMSGGGNNFPDDVRELMDYLAPSAGHERVRAIPGAGVDVPVWLLGSSLYSAQLAAVMGLPYSFAGHFAPEQMMEAIHVYRSGFQASRYLKKPYVMIGLQVVAADSQVEAELLATTLYQRFLGIIRNQRVNLLPPTDNMDAVWRPGEKELVLGKLSNAIIGDKDRVRQGLLDFINTTQADELMILSDMYEHRDRLHSFELISEIHKG